jgi:lipoyl(octanoyl) transferase
MRVYPLFRTIDLGRMAYEPALQEQLKIYEPMVAAKLRGEKSTDHGVGWVLTVEHEPVYTLGKSGDQNHLLLSNPDLQRLGAEFHRSSRGGDITFHGPGQLVAYPILDLEALKPDIHWYMRSLEESVIRTLAHWGLEGQRDRAYTGVWLDAGETTARKICAMGVKTSRWVCMHGLALNVSTRLDYFYHIVPCGIADKSVTSMHHELLRTGLGPDHLPGLGEVKEKWLAEFHRCLEEGLNRSSS